MGKQYKQLREFDIEFIKKQKIFFIASCSGKEINLQPKGYDSIRVIDSETVVFLNHPGSGNRTHRDALNDGEFTIMFNSFDEKPKILKIFCKAEIIENKTNEFNKYLKLFDEKEEFVRNFFKFNIYACESSCGEGVPYMKYVEDRASLKNWMIKLDKNDTLKKYKKDHLVPPDLQKIQK